jgi:hypothetical protein
VRPGTRILLVLGALNVALVLAVVGLNVVWFGGTGLGCDDVGSPAGRRCHERVGVIQGVIYAEAAVFVFTVLAAFVVFLDRIPDDRSDRGRL